MFRIGLAVTVMALLGWLIWDQTTSPSPQLTDGPRAEAHEPDPLAGQSPRGTEANVDALETIPFGTKEAPEEGRPESELPHTRIVRVIDEVGTLIPGTRIELVKRGQPRQVITLRTSVGRARQSPKGGGKQTSLVPTGVRSLRTNEQGEAKFEGDPDEDYALRILGPGHLAVVVQHLTIHRDEAPLVVIVERGGVLYGQIRFGPEFLGSPPDDGSAGPDSKTPAFTLDMFRAGIFLTAADREASQPSSPVGSTIPLQPDGRYRIEGIPAGTWNLHGFRQIGNIGGSLSLRKGILLGPGEHKELHLDLENRLPGTVRALVTWNGQPLKNRGIFLYAVAREANAEFFGGLFVGIRTDEKGEFETNWKPGEWRAAVLDDSEKFRSFQPSGVLHPRTLRIHPNRELEVTIAFEARKNPQIQIFRADGATPASGIQVVQRASRYERDLRWPKTNADGVSQLKFIHTGTHHLFARPKRAEGATEYPEAVSLGTIVVREDNQRFVLRLPDGPEF